MFLRHVVLAAILISGTAATAFAQSDSFPFRRFSHDRSWNRAFSRQFGDQMRMRMNFDRMRMGNREFGAQLRSRAFQMRDDLRHRQFELRARLRGRLRDHSRFDLRFDRLPRSHWRSGRI